MGVFVSVCLGLSQGILDGLYLSRSVFVNLAQGIFDGLSLSQFVLVCLKASGMGCLCLGLSLSI